MNKSTHRKSEKKNFKWIPATLNIVLSQTSTKQAPQHKISLKKKKRGGEGWRTKLHGFSGFLRVISEDLSGLDQVLRTCNMAILGSMQWPEKMVKYATKCGPFLIVQATGFPLAGCCCTFVPGTWQPPHFTSSQGGRGPCFQGFQVQPFILTVPSWRSKVCQIIHIKIHKTQNIKAPSPWCVITNHNWRRGMGSKISSCCCHCQTDWIERQ